MHTRREVLRGTAAPIAIAAMGAGAAFAVAVRDDSAIEAAGAARPTLTGPDARLEELYRAWRKAEAAFGEACETEFDSIVNFEGIEVEGPDGNAHTCKAESDLKSIFPGPIPLTNFSDADLGAFVVAARGPSTEEKEEILAEIWSRYPDVHADSRTATLTRLRVAERAHRQSPEVQAHERAEAEMSSLNDRVSAVLAKIAETQADSLQGVLTKLRIWEEDGMDAGTPAEAVWDSAVADLRRLTGEASS